MKAWDAGRLVFLDETGIRTDMTRRYGRSPQGERLVEAVPAGHWTMTTLLGAIRQTRVATAMVIESGTSREVFHAFIEHCLLSELTPGDIVVMDNLAAHKSAGIQELIESTGAEVHYLPPYSPDLNPIEKLWSKLKAHLRKTKARTRTTLWKAVGNALQTVIPTDCQGYFQSCGYT